MKRYFPLCLLLVAALCVTSLTGCSKKKVLVPVEGTLTLNGEACEGATVAFTPKDSTSGESAGGVTDASGHFTVTTGVDAGCVPGEYSVTVFQIENTGDSALTAKSVNKFPAQFADPATSGLTASVTKNMEPLKFDIEN